MREPTSLGPTPNKRDAMQLIHTPHPKEGNVPVTDYSPESMVVRAIRNAKPRQCGEAPRWVAVMDTFALGSTFAAQLCRIHGLDPDEMVSGPRCISCNP